MVDRTIAPAFVKTNKINLLQAEQREIKGIPVHLIRTGTQEVAKVEVVFNAGKWYEPSSGVAYFTTNMLREGTQSHDSKSISQILDNYGAHLDVNSTLDFGKISIYSLSKHLEKLIPVFFEMIKEPVFPEKPLNLLKEIERQQLKIQLLKPKIRAQRIFRNVLFGDTAYGKSMSVEDIDAISRGDVQEHFNSNYQNYEIFISGQFDDNELTNLLHLNLDTAGALDLQKSAMTPDYKKQVIDENVEGSLQSSLRLGFPFVEKHHDDYIPFQILNHILGGYFGSRLMKNLREDKGFTYGIHSSVAPMKNSSYFTIATDVVKASAQQAIDEIIKELTLLKEEEIPLDELETVKNHIAGSFQADITSPFSLMDKYKSVYLHNMDYSYYSNYFDILEDITTSQLKELANKYFSEDNLSIVKVG